MPPLAAFYVTISTGPGRTADRLIQAPDLYGASWLYRRLYPEAEVILVRRVRDGWSANSSG